MSRASSAERSTARHDHGIASGILRALFGSSSSRGRGVPAMAPGHGIGRAALSAVAAAAAVTAVPAPALAQIEPCPNASLRTGPSANLPDCRAYEQVSPVEKNGFDILTGVEGDVRTQQAHEGGPVSADGRGALFASMGPLAGQPFRASTPTAFVAWRAPGGWGPTVPLYPRPFAEFNPDPGMIMTTRDVAPDLATTLVGSRGLTREHLPPGDNNGLYRRDGATGSFALLTSPTPANLLTSRDLQHVAWRDNVRADNPDGDGNVHEWTDGRVGLVNVATDGTPIAPGGALLGGPRRGTGRVGPARNAVSDDGRHIFFSGPVLGIAGFASDDTAIYRRTDGATTALASPSKRSSPDPEGPKAKFYLSATPDGSRVFFMSAEHLTDDANTGPTRAGSDLYRYDFAADALVNISAETNDVDGAQVEGLLGISDDGTSVYYVARGQVVAGQGTVGQANLYLWRDDGTADGDHTFITTLAPFDFGDLSAGRDADSINWNTDTTHFPGDVVTRVTPDGRHLLFQSTRSLAGQPTGGFRQVYLYDAVAEGGAGRLLCVSCNPRGLLPTGPSDVTGGTLLDPRDLPRSLSVDGRRVFFDSADALLPQDTNGKVDVYVWQDGRIDLLSTGKSSFPTTFYNASADGNNAFFLTREALVGQDGDTNVDLYNARVNGGFPEPRVLIPCRGDECQGPPSGAPGLADRGSTVFEERGDAMAGPPPSLSIRRVTAKQRVRLSRGRRIGLRVLTGRAGMVRVVARGRVGGRWRVVARGRARAREAGTTWVRIRLSRPARRKLARGQVLRIRVAARSTGAAEVDRVPLRLKRPRRTQRAR